MAYDTELAALVREAIEGEPGLSEARMFGGLAFLVNGHMAVAASSQGGLLLRVPPERTDELSADPAAAPFVMRGREMVGWLRVAIDATVAEAELDRWVGIGVGYARQLPPKA
ncbi:MAG: TfoX/Sxy family protein [Kineosporiaceae bacterium]